MPRPPLKVERSSAFESPPSAPISLMIEGVGQRLGFSVSPRRASGRTRGTLPGQSAAGYVSYAPKVRAGLVEPAPKRQDRLRVDPRRRQQHFAEGQRRCLRLGASPGPGSGRRGRRYSPTPKSTPASATIRAPERSRCCASRRRRSLSARRPPAARRCRPGAGRAPRHRRRSRRRSNSSGSIRPGCSAVSAADQPRIRRGGSRRATEPTIAATRSGKTRPTATCRGRRAAPPRRRPGRRRTWPPGRGPTVSYRLNAIAIAIFVPTPSVELTRIGSRMPAGRAIAEAKPPSPPITSGGEWRRPRLDQLDGSLARVDVHAGVAVGAPRPAVLVPAPYS